jgi:hypothetical protein
MNTFEEVLSCIASLTIILSKILFIVSCYKLSFTCKWGRGVYYAQGFHLHPMLRENCVFDSSPTTRGRLLCRVYSNAIRFSLWCWVTQLSTICQLYRSG